MRVDIGTQQSEIRRLAYWDRLTGLLRSMELLCVADRDALTLYAATFSRLGFSVVGSIYPPAYPRNG